jgi:transcriptional regulator with XRE-family HTH domain
MIGDRIRYHRFMLGITQKELCARSNISKGTLESAEYSRTKNLLLSTAVKIKKGLDLDTVELLMMPISQNDRAEQAKVIAMRAKNKFN